MENTLFFESINRTDVFASIGKDKLWSKEQGVNISFDNGADKVVSFLDKEQVQKLADFLNSFLNS